MSTEIILRRNTHELARSNGTRQIVDAALQRLRGMDEPAPSHHIQRSACPERRLASYRAVAEDVVDIPRWCAVHGEPYVARFTYSQSIRFKASLLDQYDEEASLPGLVADHELTEEACPWCGGMGIVVRCGVCKRFMCTGKVVRDYFRCHAACGGEGKIRARGFNGTSGISPGRLVGGSGFGR